MAPSARFGSASQNGGTKRRPMYLNIGDTQPVLTGTALIPLSLSVSGTIGTLSAFGSTYCTAASGPNPCPNVNFMASPPMWQSPTPVALTLAATVLNAACNAPSGAPVAAPGFTPGCYIGVYEGGGGPYLVQGPVTGSAGSLSLTAETSALNFNPSEAYNFFLMYVTAIASPPPPMTPSPDPSPTEFATQPPPATPVPTATPTPIVTIAPSPCATSTPGDDEGDDIQHVVHRMDDDGDDGSCGSPAPKPSPTCSGDDDGDGGHHHHHHHRDRRHHHKHHGGDDDCEDS